MSLSELISLFLFTFKNGLLLKPHLLKPHWFSWKPFYCILLSLPGHVPLHHTSTAFPSSPTATTTNVPSATRLGKIVPKLQTYKNNEYSSVAIKN